MTHGEDDETTIESVDPTPALDVCQRVPVSRPSVMYPIVETWMTGQPNGWCGDPQPTPLHRVWHRFAPGCFHDLPSATPGELAGMGLALLGNLIKAVQGKALSLQADVRLELRHAADAEPIPLPWPGMPDARPIPLDLAQLPFEAAMFLNDEGEGRYRIHRLDLMRRIEAVWLPALIQAWLLRTPCR